MMCLSHYVVGRPLKHITYFTKELQKYFLAHSKRIFRDKDNPVKFLEKLITFTLRIVKRKRVKKCTDV